MVEKRDTQPLIDIAAVFILTRSYTRKRIVYGYRRPCEHMSTLLGQQFYRTSNLKRSCINFLNRVLKILHDLLLSNIQRFKTTGTGCRLLCYVLILF